MTNLLFRYSADLKKLHEAHQKRQLTPIRGIDFTSNDYLAFSRAPQIRNAVAAALNDGTALGSGASRLLRGNHTPHEELEIMAAKFFGSTKSLYFANGYTANYAVLTTLPKRHDLIVFDALSHASIREGVFASLAKGVKVPHNDVDAVERTLANWNHKRSASSLAWLVVESLYSMDGDCAPLEDLFRVADRYAAIVIVDEAHATGVYGKRARGLTEPFEGRDNLVAIHTCGKALGVSGGLVCAPAELIDFMISKCRPFIYSTAPPPINAVAVSAAIRLLEQEPSRQLRLQALISTANQKLEQQFQLKTSGSQIIPFVIGNEKATLTVASEMQKAGFDLRAIRPPTVAPGTSRLRITITLHVSESDICNMFDTLHAVMRDLALHLPLS